MKVKLVFFGTGPVSLATLQGIHEAFEIEAVITKQAVTAPNGRLHESPVKEWAERHQIRVFTPANKQQLAELFETESFDSRVGLVVDYGIIIPYSVIDSFEFGIVNSHFSLLPKYRGADPITAVILNGDDETGVSLMLVEEQLDTGPILGQKTLKVDSHETTISLTSKLVELSNNFIQETLPTYVSGSVKPENQSTKITPSMTKKVQKADGVINWQRPAAEIDRQVRAYLGWPGSRTTLAGKEATITKADVLGETLFNAESCSAVGAPFRTPDGQLAVCCGQGALVIEKLKPAGKPEMSGQAFLAGHQI